MMTKEEVVQVILYSGGTRWVINADWKIWASSPGCSTTPNAYLP